MNEITIHGNLTDEPIIRYSSEAKAAVNFTVAVNRRRFDRQANRWVDLAPVFHRVVAFGQLAENAANLPKGASVAVTGELADDSWTPEDSDRKIYRTQVLAADIAASLRFATVAITKNPRRGSNAEPETVAAGG